MLYAEPCFRLSKIGHVFIMLITNRTLKIHCKYNPSPSKYSYLMNLNWKILLEKQIKQSIKEFQALY